MLWGIAFPMPYTHQFKIIIYTFQLTEHKLAFSASLIKETMFQRTKITNEATWVSKSIKRRLPTKGKQYPELHKVFLRPREQKKMRLWYQMTLLIGFRFYSVKVVLWFFHKMNLTQQLNNAAFVATGSNFKRDPGDQSSCLTHGTNEGKGRFRILRRGNGCWFLRPYGSAVFL